MAYDDAEPDESEDVTPSKTKLVLTDDEFLSIVGEQRKQSIGFGFSNDSELAADRERALNYFKGEMPDVKVMKDRSQAVSTDIAEAVETILPDLVEILTGGEDVATFQAVGEADEQQAEAETDYVRFVLLQRNPGFLVLTTAIKDSLLIKVGVLKFWWEGGPEHTDEAHEGKTAEEFLAAMQGGADVRDITAGDPTDDQPEPTYNFTIRTTKDTGRACVSAVPSDDFTVAQDTVALIDTAYCAHRSRPRIQDLIAQGYDAKIIEGLPAYSGSGNGNSDETTQLARDTAGEHAAGTFNQATHKGLQIVEVVEHYVRLDADGDDKPELWKVVTGGGETVFIDKERVEQIPFAALTPYLVPHRFYGRSVADVLIEVQKIKTALQRMLLDSGYFALNQRMEVATDGSNEWTISDLLHNAPNIPVRSKSGNAVRPLTAGALNFDVMGALEYMSVVGEQRSGIKRHSMGMNPDTLHDTASGALGQLNEAQKRIRFMARVFAETGIKDLFLGLHQLIRANAKSPVNAPLRNGWAQIDPSQWPERENVVVEVGIGSGGRDQKLAGMNMLAGLMEKAISLQGGQLTGPLVNLEGASKLLNKFPSELGLKGQFFMSAKDIEAQKQQAAQNPQPPKPDPEMAKVRAQQQSDAADRQLAQQKAQADAQNRQAAQALAERAQSFNEQLALMQMQQARELALAEIDAKYATQTDTARIRAEAEGLRVGADLTIKAAGQHHDMTMAAQEAAHARDAISHQAAHDHVAAIRDAALAPEPQPPATPAAEPDPSAPE